MEIHWSRKKKGEKLENASLNMSMQVNCRTWARVRAFKCHNEWTEAFQRNSKHVNLCSDCHYSCQCLQEGSRERKDHDGKSKISHGY